MKFGGLEKILKKSAMFIVTGSLAFNLLTGCNKEESPVAPINNPPEVYITEGPSNGEEINEDSVEFGWLGFDPDGDISMYKYKLNPTMNNYQETNETSHTFTNLGSGPYVFSVFAKDDAGEWSIEPAERNFSVYKEYTLTLQPGPDEGIDAGVVGHWINGIPTSYCDENYNYGTMYVGCSEWTSGGDLNVEKDRGYIKFELDSIPNNASILNAIMSLYAYDLLYGGTTGIQVQKVEISWIENEITWNNQPSFNSYIYDTQTITQLEIFYDFDITGLGNDWLNSSNNGLVLKVPYEWGIDIYCKFYTSDYWDSSKRPKLKLDYVINQ